MPGIEKRTISLPAAQASYIDALVETGTYASASDRQILIDAPEARVRLAIVTCGAGASTGFAIGEELITSLFDTGATA